MAEEGKVVVNEIKKEKNTPALLGFIFSFLGPLALVGLILSIIGTVTAKNYKKARKGLAIAGIVISSIMIIIVGASSSSSDNNSVSPSGNTSVVDKQDESKKIEYTKIDIDTLEDALANNAAAAKDTYNGKYLEITGRLGAIDSDLKYISLLSTTNEWDIIGVHCTLKNQKVKDVVKTLNKDQTIIVKGKITDVGEVLGYYLTVDEIIAQ